MGRCGAKGDRVALTPQGVMHYLNQDWNPHVAF